MFKSKEKTEAVEVIQESEFSALRAIIEKELAARRVYAEASEALDGIERLSTTSAALVSKNEALARENDNLNAKCDEAAAKLADLKDEQAKVVEDATVEADRIISAANQLAANIKLDSDTAFNVATAELEKVTKETAEANTQLQEVLANVKIAEATLEEIRAKLKAI